MPVYALQLPELRLRNRGSRRLPVRPGLRVPRTLPMRYFALQSCEVRAPRSTGRARLGGGALCRATVLRMAS